MDNRIFCHFVRLAIVRALLVLSLFGLSLPAAERMGVWNGHRVAYLDEGTGPQAVVLIHGWTCDASFWRLQMEPLAREWRVIAVDLPGHGKSDKPNIEYTQEAFAGAIRAVLQQAGVQRAVLVGHSMGAAVARQFLLDYSQLGVGMVIVDGAVWKGAPGPIRKKPPTPFVLGLRGPQSKRVAANYIETMFTAETSAELRREIRTKMLATPGHIAASSIEHLNSSPMWSKGPTDVPSLAIYAARKNPDENRKVIESFFPRLSYREWQGAGHFLMMERPAQFNQELLDFLRQFHQPDTQQ